MSKPIFGLFDNQKDLEDAAAKLHKLGGIEQIEIVDRERIGGAINLIPGGTIMQSPAGPGTTPGVPPMVKPESDQVDSIASYLEDLDFDEAEARFVAQALKNGGSLVVLEAEDDAIADEAQQIMRQANAVQAG